MPAVCCLCAKSVATPADTLTKGRNRAAAKVGRKKKRKEDVMDDVLAVGRVYPLCSIWRCSL